MLIHRHQMQPADVEDVLSDSVVKFLSAPAGQSSTDGLFVVIALRRAIDLLRSRSREVPLSERQQLAVPPDRDHLEKELLARAIRRYASGRKNADAERLLGVAGRVLEGLSFVEACRESGIPRGSRSRYHKNLELFLDRLTRRS
jgi:DNA-directed RNA polymerase specialized sigma24 family protein